jgi:hypothetical protein
MFQIHLAANPAASSNDFAFFFYETPQVAIKLIRKESVDNSTRLSKVEREISVLRVSS